jgi:hypothetical protein
MERNKFGLMDDDVSESSGASQTLSEKLTAFPAVRARAPIDLAAVDAAAAPHGFVSREATSSPVQAVPHGRRRRAVPVPTEPTRHLAIRLVESQYNRFLAYADLHKLTYHDALKKLLDGAGE